MSYAGKYGYLGGPNGEAINVSVATNIAANWDLEVLMPLDYIERPFRARIASAVAVELRPTVTVATAPNGTNTAYNLEGAAGNPNRTAGARYVLDVKLENVAIGDARYINNAIDGDNGPLGENPTLPGSDLNGRVKYEFPAEVNAGELRIYVTHL